MGDRTRRAKSLDFITKAYPQNPEARYQVGYLALQDKDYKRAEQVFGDLYKANPEDWRGLVGRNRNDGQPEVAWATPSRKSQKAIPASRSAAI